MIKAIIFDLDGTLYKSKRIERKFAEAAHHTLAKHQKLDLDTARELVEQRRTELSRKRGYRIPYTHTLRSFGVPVQFWHEKNAEWFDARHYLKKNHMLITALKTLRKKHRLAVVTNNNRIQAERVLSALGVKSLFSVVQTFTDTGLLKPDPEVFLRIARRFRVKPSQCLSVGDRIDVDLAPAARTGMKTFRVAGPRGINRLLRLKTLFL